MLNIRLSSALCAALLALTACNLNFEGVPSAQVSGMPTANAQGFIIVTPNLPTPNAEGLILITATPDPAQASSPTPPPSATPTPFQQPTEALAQAERALLNGQYEQAAQTYQAILAQGEQVEAAIRAQAAFQLGQAALREGLFSQAEAALSQLIGDFPQDARRPQAHFLRGDARLGLAQWRGALEDFQQYLALRPGLIDSYAYERIADAQLALSQSEAALQAYSAALSAERTLVPQLALREKVAQILLNLGRVDEAVAQYDAILQVARNAPYRASIDYLAAQALRQAGRTQQALERAQRIFSNYPETRTAYQAMRLLQEAGVALDGFQRGKVAFTYGDYQEAINAFNEYSSSQTLDKIPAELYLLLGRAYREIGNSQAALVAFQTIVETYVNDPLFGDALLEQGRTRFLSGDIPAAIERYLAIADRYPTLTTTAAEALWRAGYLYGTNNEPSLSRQVFTRLADLYPGTSQASSGLLLAASAAVNAQEWAIAENLYGRIAILSSNPQDKAAAYWWVGRLAQQRGDSRAATESFALAAQAAPDSYFAARARDIQQGVQPFQPPPALRFSFDEEAERAQAEAWLRSTFNLGDEVGDLSQPAALSSDPRLVRGAELWALAAYDEALTEFRAICDEARSARDVATSYRMARLLRDKGAYSQSIVCAADVIVAAGVGTLDAPPYIARMRFPAYYADLVQAEAARYGFDPLLMLALIRQESLFNTTAVSSASARGLTQVIPSTARYIAGKLGVASFQDTDLFRPYLGVAFGAFYLDEQLRLFKGNAAAALAAYNAGPGRALDWSRLAGGDVDALVLTITFQETRSYVERIYSHYAIYRALYGA